MTTTTTLQITVEDNGILLIRQGKRAFDDDGSLIGERFQRTSLEPGDSVSNQPVRIQRIAQAVWTQAVIDAYLAAKAAHTFS
jgi:hypothetical protein